MITVYICLLKEIANHINELAIISLHLKAIKNTHTHHKSLPNNKEKNHYCIMVFVVYITDTLYK